MSNRGRIDETATTRNEELREDRKTERVSMAKGVNLDVKVKDGYIGRWVSLAIEGRVQRLQEAGYEFQVDALGNQIKRSKGGSDLVLMIVPEEYWREDFELGQKKIDDQVNEQQRLSKDEYIPDGRKGVISRDSVI